LSIERVGLDDDFFEIGGHSLLATQIVLELQKVLHVDLSLRDLFESRTPRQLARVSGEMLLKEVEGLSEEEAVQLVSQRRTDQ
jgi:acyl carrier protein